MATAKRYRKPDPRIGKPRARPRTRTGSIVVSMDPGVFQRLSIASGTFSVLDKAVEAEFRNMVAETFTEPLANFMRAAGMAAGRHGPRLARTIEAKRGRLPQIQIGSWGEPTWAGAEFGGQRGTMADGRKEYQSMSWPNVSGRPKTRKIIRRQQTRQFLPHAGRDGYIAFPTWRRHDRELSEQLVASVDNFVSAVMEV